MVSLFGAIIAGFFATLAMSIPMFVMKQRGRMPMDPPPKMIAARLGLGERWVLVHFATGIAYALIYAALLNILSLRSSVPLAMAYSIALPWFVVIFVVLPLNGLGVGGLKLSKRVPVMTLITHLVYGFVLGRVLSNF